MQPEHEISGDAKIMQGDGVGIVLDGKQFQISDKTPRQSRPLMAGMLRLQPGLFKVAAVVKKITGKDGKVDNAAMAELTPDENAAMLDFFEPLAQWIIQCGDNDPALADAVEYASEQELVKAFTVLRGMLQSPFVERLKTGKRKRGR
jgi:hypothetical protein